MKFLSEAEWKWNRHNPYFSRRFFAMETDGPLAFGSWNVTILILVEGSLQWERDFLRFFALMSQSLF